VVEKSDTTVTIGNSEPITLDELEQSVEYLKKRRESMVGEIRFNKIKYDNKGRVCLVYDEIVSDDKVNEYSMKCTDAPRGEYKEALAALKIHVVDICEIPKNQAAKLEIRGVSLSWKDGIMGTVITALKDLERSNAPLVLNTPHLPEESYSKDGEMSCLSLECVEDIRTLIEEARRYLEGDRAQIDLFAPEVEAEIEKAEER